MHGVGFYSVKELHALQTSFHNIFSFAMMEIQISFSLLEGYDS